MQLGARLKTVADFVEQGVVVADIGTDHAYLPIYLVEQGIVPRALACDVHSGPYQAAKKTVANAMLQDKIDVRLGDGIMVLKPEEVDVVTIAGMGGATMIDILAANINVTENLKGVILQPQNAAAELRRWLIANQWKIVNESLVVDEGRLYEIIYAKHGREMIEEEILFDIGPRIWEKRDLLLSLQLEHLIVQVNRVLKGMESSETAKKSSKYQKCKEKIKQLEMKLSCLSNVK